MADIDIFQDLKNTVKNIPDHGLDEDYANDIYNFPTITNWINDNLLDKLVNAIKNNNQELQEIQQKYSNIIDENLNEHPDFDFTPTLGGHSYDGSNLVYYAKSIGNIEAVEILEG